MMNNTEAKSLLGKRLHGACRTFFRRARRDDRPRRREKHRSKSEANYQIELNVFWDSKPGGDLRIIGSIDDSGWRAFVPLTESLIMKRDGKLV
jgi:hypothetical protein